MAVIFFVAFHTYRVHVFVRVSVSCTAASTLQSCAPVRISFPFRFSFSQNALTSFLFLILGHVQFYLFFPPSSVRILRATVSLGLRVFACRPCANSALWNHAHLPYLTAFLSATTTRDTA